jgi:ATP-dependent Clp protease ATP-binding subunit ClpC
LRLAAAADVIALAAPVFTPSWPDVFEHFTEQAREVVALAQQEARLMRHGRVGTEHLLIALAWAGDDDASAVLGEHGLTGERTRAAVVGLVGLGNDAEGGDIPFSPAAHDALMGAWEEAMRLGHTRAEPAHLMLAILRPPDALARRVLTSAGATPPAVRSEILRRLGEQRPRATPTPSAGSPRADGEALLAILERRGAVAAWLRERGVDEQAVRRMLGDD